MTKSFLTDHANMTPAEIEGAMLAFLEGQHAFDENMPATPENVNWMTAVYAIESGVICTAADLTNLLAAMEKHYAGPISIHEGWGGCEADSNKELITEKLGFDLFENMEMHNVRATLAAIELGWLNADEYEQGLDQCVNGMNLVPEGNVKVEALESDWLVLNHEGASLSVYAHGKTEADRWLFREESESPCTEAEYHRLLLRLGQFYANDDKCAYVRFWLARRGAPMREKPL
jgi:hypothetical protein